MVMVFGAVVLFSSVQVLAADFTLVPSLAVSEEYTDNVFETSGDRRSDYITRLLPGLALQYRAALWDWEGGYTFDYRYYARRSPADEITHNLGVHGLVRVMDEFFFLDLNDTYRRVSLDVTRDNTNESLFFNQSDQNVFTGSPYFVWRVAPQTNLRTGYRYVNTWYKEPTVEDRADHVAFAELTHELSTRASLNGGYTFTHQNAVTSNYDRHDVFAGGRYEYSARSFFFGQVGNTWIRYSFGRKTENLYWNAGASKNFDALTATVTTGVRYSEDPLRVLTRERFYSGSLEYPFERGQATLSVNYSEFDGSGGTSLDTKRYTVGLRGRYELLPDLTGSLAFEADNFVRRYMSNSPRRFNVSSELSYLLSRGLTMRLSHIFVDYFSPTVAADNRQINRVLLELRKAFE
jgi:hypothetical protein